MKKIRAVAIIINKKKVLVIHRLNNGREYYVFPGGGIEKSESVEQAVIREVDEETSLEIRIEKLLYHHIYDDNSEQYFYLCSHISGEPKLGSGNELIEMGKNKASLYQPLWYDINKVGQLLLYPLEIRDWLLEDIKSNFASPSKTATLKISDLRQTL